jgi:hypothetical protein
MGTLLLRLLLLLLVRRVLLLWLKMHLSLSTRVTTSEHFVFEYMRDYQ